MTKCSDHASPDDGWRAFLFGTAAVAAGTVAATTLRPDPAGAADTVDPEKIKLMKEATRLAIESVENG